MTSRADFVYPSIYKIRRRFLFFVEVSSVKGRVIMNKRLWIIPTAIFILAMIFISYYKLTHIPVWGFHFAKNDIKDVIVMTNHHTYMINDKDAVLGIAEAVSTMEKATKIQTDNYPPESQPASYTKILIQTKDNTTYGGDIWKLGSTAVLASNGYYWRFDDDKMSDKLHSFIHNAQVLD